MMQKPDFLAELDRLATEAQTEEIRFRKSFAEEVAKRERARAFAFRRASFLGRMTAAARAAETEEAAVSAQVAAFRSELGWHGDGETRTRILAAWTAVAQAVWKALRPEPEGEADPVRAMADFETWYEAEIGSPFLAVFDQEPFEAPLVEF